MKAKFMKPRRRRLDYLDRWCEKHRFGPLQKMIVLMNARIREELGDVRYEHFSEQIEAEIVTRGWFKAPDFLITPQDDRSS